MWDQFNIFPIKERLVSLKNMKGERKKLCYFSITDKYINANEHRHNQRRHLNVVILSNRCQNSVTAIAEIIFATNLSLTSSL